MRRNHPFFHFNLLFISNVGLPKEGPQITGIRAQQYGIGDLGMTLFIKDLPHFRHF
jgi:hypothetical protein